MSWCLVCLWPPAGWGADVHVALASNFLPTFELLKKDFEQDTGHRTIVSAGSSGKLFAQITHGAPFDIFFSADNERPAQLEKNGMGELGTRRVYAKGRLTLWSTDPSLITDDLTTLLRTAPFSHLAIANPRTAPYGRAAQQVLQALGVWGQLVPKLVQGENIGQTFQFVSSRNAELGFVALAQVLNSQLAHTGSRWDVPSTHHDPLIQEMILLKSGSRNPAAQALWEYIQGLNARERIEELGYEVESRPERSSLGSRHDQS